MKKMLVIGCMAAVLGSFTSCLQEPDTTPVGGRQITLSLGFEGQTSVSTPETASTKTYLAGKEVRWLKGDKTIYVFDTEGQKNTFTSATDTAAPKKEFTGNISENSEISSVIWTGVQKNDECTFENGIFSGSTLKVVNPQNINNGNSFAQNANIAVMKPGDGVLRNVFGYIKYTIPTEEKVGNINVGKIKSVTFSAAEPLAGKVQIDYTDNEPVAKIVDDAASTSLTVNTRNRSEGLEAGDLYAVVPVGTYTNFNIKVTLADDTSFDLPVSDPVTIVRGKYTTAGTLPVEAPDSPVEPEEPGESFVWPNDPAAFDYELDLNESRRAEYPEADRLAAGVTGQGALSGPALIDGITYCGPGVTFYGNRMTIEQVKSTHWSEEYPDIIPSQRYLSFKINRPGTVSFYQSTGSALDRVPTYYLALATTVNGVRTVKVVDEVTPAEMTDERPGNPYAEEYMKYHVTLTVSKEDMAGVTEPATVYIYHSNPKFNTLNIHYYPLTWTSNAETNISQRKPKFLLAGDSLVTEYGEASYPQMGWGQRIAPFLGENVKVRNYAVGGESTQSFIDNGRWGELIRTVLRNDIVLIWFMHNDKGSSRPGYQTDPATTYKDNLRKFISETRDKGGVPVLVTSILSYRFGADGKAQHHLGDFPDAMRAVAQETDTPLIDVEQWSYDWLSELGAEGAEPYYVLGKRDPANNDTVHITEAGADVVAEYIANELVRQGIWTK